MAEAVIESRNVYQLVAAVQAELAQRGIGKNQKNTFDNYNFRGIDDVYNALGPLLSRHGLVVYPEVTAREITERQSQKGGALFHVVLDIIYHFVSSHDGTEVAVPVIGEAMDRGDKAINKAMSAAYKNACFQTFCIPVQGQDSENESHEVQPKSNRAIDAALEGVTFTPQQQAMISQYKASFVLAHENQDDAAVIELAEELKDDQELKMGVWAQLDSKVRSYIRKVEKERG